MENKVSNQIKSFGTILFVISIVLGVLCFVLGTTLAVFNFINNEMNNGYIAFGSGILIFAFLFIVGKFWSIVLNGYSILVKNSNKNNECVELQKKIYNELHELNDKLTVKQVLSIDNKEDISAIKKSTKVKPRDSKNKLEDLDNTKTKKIASSEDIKEKLAKAKGVVQKTMAVKSQVAANTISTSMLDDISDKNNIEVFETPEGYSQIEPELFKDCKNLEEVVITDNIKLIGNYAFSGCDALETITIGKGVGVIEKSAFEGCTGLDKIIYKGSKKQWEEVVIQSGNEILKRIDIEFEEK